MFLSALVVKKVNDQEWELQEDFKYASKHLDRVITVPKGFVMDFASVPRLPLVYTLFGGTAQRSAVIHDWLYTCKAHPDSTPEHPISINRKTADEIFYEACKNEMSSWKAYTMWLGVRAGGSEYWRT